MPKKIQSRQSVPFFRDLFEIIFSYQEPGLFMICTLSTSTVLFDNELYQTKLKSGCDKVVLELVFILVPLSFETPFVLLCFVSLASQEELLGRKFLKEWLCFTFVSSLCQNVTFRETLYVMCHQMSQATLLNTSRAPLLGT